MQLQFQCYQGTQGFSIPLTGFQLHYQCELDLSDTNLNRTHIDALQHH